MVSHELGVIRYDLWKPGFQRGGNAAMQLLPSAAQQSAVGGILHQGMLEGVFRIGWHPAPEDQFGTYQLIQSIVQFLLRHACHGADQLIRERTPKRGAD